MTQARKRAVFTFLIWGSVMAAFSVIFFLGEGPEQYSLEKWRRVAGAGIIAFGYLSYGLMLFLTRIRPGIRAVGSDERDEEIQRRANATAFVVVLVYVFTLSILLWERHQGSGFVPVGWMWFLAYSTSFAAFISSSVIALILESKASGHGQS
jgi:ABC-type transport system involved in cytochrome c biogenesis permease subunit